MRLAAAIGVIAVTLAAAVYVHQQHSSLTGQSCSSSYFGPPKCVSYQTSHPSWEDPVAVLLVIGGIAAAAGFLTARRKVAV